MTTKLLVAGAYFLFLCIRGILLWVVIPIAFCAWLMMLLLRPMFRKPYLPIGKLVGWAGLNLRAAIAQALLRPLGYRIRFTPWADLHHVKHRVNWADPW